MADRMRLDENINQALFDANENKGGDKYTDKLTKEEKDAIRREVRADFKEDNAFSILTTKELQGIVKSTYDKLVEGENISDSDKKFIYEQNKKTVLELPNEYLPIKVKLAIKNNSIAYINEAFSDNWGIYDSFKSLADKKFGEYVKRHKEQIKIDSVEELKSVFGVTLDMDTKEFYDRITNKFKQLTYDERLEYDEVFKFLVYIRFGVKYDKVVDGEWTLKHTPALRNIEIALNELPEGHFLSNDELTMITNKDYSGGNSGGYAWYSSNERRINFSADAIDYGTIFGILSNQDEFKSTLYHEIGHAVSHKLGGNNVYDYKRFAVECGWTYQSKELRAGMTATGDQKDIPRTGSNAHLDLITTYACKAPEEAFAEYYSFYNLHRDSIDKFLKTKDKKFLQKHSQWTAPGVDSNRPLGSAMSYRKLDHNDPAVNTFESTVKSLSEGGHDIECTLVSPWATRVQEHEKNNMDMKSIRREKDRPQREPAFAYRDGLSRVVFNGAEDVEISRMNKKLCSTIEIPKEMYFKLRDSGLSNSDITNCLVTKFPHIYPKQQIDIPEEIKGLKYRDKLLDYRQLSSNYAIFEMMHKIFHSEELKKAIQDLFSQNDIEEEIEKSFSNTSEMYLKGQISDELYQETVQRYNIEKGKKANTGEIRDWGGVKMQKKPDGTWVPFIQQEATSIEDDFLYTLRENFVLDFDKKDLQIFKSFSKNLPKKMLNDLCAAKLVGLLSNNLPPEIVKHCSTVRVSLVSKYEHDQEAGGHWSACYDGYTNSMHVNQDYYERVGNDYYGQEFYMRVLLHEYGHSFYRLNIIDESLLLSLWDTEERVSSYAETNYEENFCEVFAAYLMARDDNPDTEVNQDLRDFAEEFPSSYNILKMMHE